jgi:hypothetical protein
MLPRGDNDPRLALQGLGETGFVALAEGLRRR